jgi:hypothetical protein
MSDTSDIDVINKRLEELSREFRDLSSLKKSLSQKNKKSIILEKFGKYKYIIKDIGIEIVDYNSILDNYDANMGYDSFGMPVIGLTKNGHTSFFAVSETEEEARSRDAFDSVAKIIFSAKLQDGETTQKINLNEALENIKKILSKV